MSKEENSKPTFQRNSTQQSENQWILYPAKSQWFTEESQSIDHWLLDSCIGSSGRMEQHFQKLNKANMEPRILYSAKLFFKCQGYRKVVINLQGLKKYSIHEPNLRNPTEDELHPRDYWETSAKRDAFNMCA